MPDYSDCYATLGATPETDSGTLRANYRRLIGQWHPDRFADDPVLARIAEERSKRITLAYQTLENYRRSHGVLPRIEPAAAAEDVGEPARARDPEHPGFEDRVKPRRAGASVREPVRREPGRWRHIALACSAVLALTYVSYYSQELLAPDDFPSGAPAPAPDIAKPVSGSMPGITTGSTLGEVYSIQGIPTWTEGNTWHYGKSKIRFSRGRVTSWSEHPDDPLRIADDPFAGSNARYFDIGSTKEEVRAVQGTPISETDAVWDYAPSRVYFENDRVVRWQESPMQPLRVRR